MQKDPVESPQFAPEKDEYLWVRTKMTSSGWNVPGVSLDNIKGPGASLESGLIVKPHM